MEHNKDSTAVSPPVEATETPHTMSSATPTPPINNDIITPPAGESVRDIASEAQPPSYEEHDKEVVPAPEVTSTAAASPPLEKTAWQTATQTPAPQPGQGLIAQRTVELNQLGEEPRLINCPFCHHQAMTRVQKESTSATGMAAVGCCLFGGIICAFLPYCMEMCHDSHHFCSNCNQKVAIRPHDGQVQLFLPQNPVVTAPGQIQPPQPVAMTHENMAKN
ncbi:hypothetical protein PEBR_39537 [Penicillium brasilianum]|uniref:LITAF domain-containing protein n=1 Tax=Penicillium brasilianum TaxID=104259 RepID=A0A1S9RAK9_PENBI|nr:hypothetical protein PEBR_39537 [Penicillium brasilianum]